MCWFVFETSVASNFEGILKGNRETYQASYIPPMAMFPPGTAVGVQGEFQLHCGESIPTGTQGRPFLMTFPDEVRAYMSITVCAFTLAHNVRPASSTVGGHP